MPIKIDMVKAREIAKNKLRSERAPVLESLDVKFMRAIESGNTNLQLLVTQQKEELRDITKHESILNSSNETELKNAMSLLIEKIQSVG